METKVNIFEWLNTKLKEFMHEKICSPEYEVVDLRNCIKTGAKIAVIKVGSRHIIEKYVNEIITDMSFLEGFDKKTIRTLTYIATVETYTPDYYLLAQKMGNEVDEYLLEIKSRKDNKTIKKTPTEIVNNKGLIEKFSPSDANKIGYMAGIKEAVKEFKIKATIL